MVISGRPRQRMLPNSHAAPKSTGEAPKRTGAAGRGADSCATARLSARHNNVRSVDTVFQTLPGTNLRGQRRVRQSGRRAGQRRRRNEWLSGFSLAVTFEGEFSGNVTSCAGKGVASTAVSIDDRWSEANSS